MKQLLLVLLLLSGSGASAFEKCSEIQPYGGEKPVPWGTEIPFPWKNIEGIWFAEDMMDFYFEFKIIRNVRFTRYLQVNMVQTQTGAYIAQGVGVARKNDRIVRARVRSVKSEEYYVLLSNYEMREEGKVRVETYLTFRPLSNDPKEDKAFRIHKLTVGGPLCK